MDIKEILSFICVSYKDKLDDFVLFFQICSFMLIKSKYRFLYNNIAAHGQKNIHVAYTRQKMSLGKLLKLFIYGLSDDFLTERNIL